MRILIDPEVVDGRDENERDGEDGNGGNVVGVSQTTNQSHMKLIQRTWLIIRVRLPSNLNKSVLI